MQTHAIRPMRGARRLIASAVLIGLTPLLFAACGDDEEPEVADPATATATATEEATETATTTATTAATETATETGTATESAAGDTTISVATEELGRAHV